MDYRTAFVTGASSGIGRALCLRLARDGVEVGLAARRVEALEALAAEIRDAGGRARVYPLDVTVVGEVLATVRRADEEMDGLDLVVANAGSAIQRWSGKLRWEEDVAPLIALNVSGASATLTAAIPGMVKRRRGHLVGISSLAQYRGLPKSAAYSASKAFLSVFLEGLRVDLRSCDVSVTDVRPGFVRTPINELNKYPMPFMMEAEEAADIIWKGIRRRSPVVAFPWQLATVVRSATLLPAAIYDRAVTQAKG